MRIEVVTLFPELISDACRHGVLGRAAARGLVSLGLTNPRDHAVDVHRSVDDRPFGGGPGMVGLAAPWAAAIDHAASRFGGRPPLRVHLSAQGRRFDQGCARDCLGGWAAGQRGLLLVASRYEGLDERVVEARIDEEWSIGDFVLSGGEFAALAIIDAVTRLIPGALGDERSADQESFSAARLDWPHYTRPPDWEGRTVPAVLTSGNHAAIDRWRRGQSALRTRERRPDLLGQVPLTAQESKLIEEVLVGRGRKVEDHG